MSNHLDAVLDLIRSEVSKYIIVKQIADKFEDVAKVNFEYVVLAGLVVVAFMLFSGFGANLICHIGAFAYPLYATLVLLSSERKGPSIQFWLTYWVVYGFLGVTETVLDTILKYVPLYYPFKLAFVLWCYLPKFRGAEVIYSKLILPHFKQHESKIDEALKKIDKNIVK